MAIEIKVPSLGESVTDATVARWLKQPGEAVALDEPVVELETDKVNVEVPAPLAGILTAISAEEGTVLPVGGVLGLIDEGAAAIAPHPNPLEATLPLPPDAEAAPAHTEPAQLPPPGNVEILRRAGPAVRKMVGETGIDPTAIAASGPSARLSKADVIAAVAARAAPAGSAATPGTTAAPAPAPGAIAAPTAAPVAMPAPAAAQAAPSSPGPVRDRAPAPSGEREVRLRMTRLRQRIAERLKAAQNTAAILTTFNEIDMTRTIDLRERWRDAFEKRHGVRLGFMSIFVKAAIAALKEFPAVNGEIDGDDIVYKNHFDIGVAVGTEQGLVVPVVRDADLLSFAEIEKEIATLGRKARDGKLSISDLSGGTFTISNGGIYGSLLSTPILNPPQSGILGMHKIQRRPVAVAGPEPDAETVAIRPMMYVALSYDHRLVDGREAVSFLVRIKELVEDPSRLLFEI